ncbi:MAG TPA: hypothetical protein VNK52_16735 [Hyphomicrobiaceae bacterium]|nr:hypothetical protein [Hyphomicrobiaceae bacterium]
MRVIKIELQALLSSADPSISLASDELRGQLFREIQAAYPEISERIRQRARSYFPDSYSVFVRTQGQPDRAAMVTDLWVVDPTIRWPAGLLARSAWRLFIPIMAHAVKESIAAQFDNLNVDVRERDARISVLVPTRSWRDPVLLSAAVVVLTSVYWLLLHPAIVRALSNLW